MKRIFVDSGAWIALAVEQDRQHASAVAFYAALRAPLLTTNYVTAETATHLRYNHGLPIAHAFRNMIKEVTTNGRLAVRWIDERIEREAWELLDRYADITLSVADATSAAVARRAKCGEIFGFDSDFRALGFDVKP